MNKHSPGPWRKNSTGVIVDAGGVVVAKTLTFPHPKYWEGNKDLITAADELLESVIKYQGIVKDAQDMLAKYIIPDNEVDPQDLINDLLGLFDGAHEREVTRKANAAIDKSKGIG